MKKELGNSVWLGLNYLNKLMNGMVFFAVLANVVSQSEFGVYTYVFSLFTLIATFNSLGLNNFIYIKLATRKYDSDLLLKMSRNIQFIMAIALFSLVFVLFLMTDKIELYYLLIATTALFFKPLELYKLKLDAQLKSKVYFKFDIFIPCLFLLSKLISIFFFDDPLFVLFVLYTLESAVVGGCYYSLSYKYDAVEDKSSVGAYAFTYRQLIVEAMPVLISSSVFIVYSKVDQYMIYNLLGPEKQAVYAAALKLAEGWYFIFTAIVVSFFSSISKLYYTNATLYLESLKKLSLICNFFCYLAIIVVLIFGDFIVDMLFGNAYIDSSVVLKIAIFQSFIISASYISQRIHLLEGMQKLSVIKAVTGLFLNVTLNYFMIPIYGVSGAAFATLLSHFIALFLSNLFFKKTRYIFKLQFLTLFMINLHLLRRK
ncbi:hypothetical protein AT00_17140 [Pseudoalteromonas lipolytica SCSIO 04301]|uniref:oligosaccharide flippase family protein n=1 Tax=Pseudoalteromonas lipolytica TaxID=570156 RepID=UPI0004492B72|nr:oligosaccharide flippase family protein [Pseudoalteromonas lipolytica]EWH04887.1 hypothetical protein AT00_17140 [Pseudoalteromonas lipolytica SCSIO 04301]